MNNLMRYIYFNFLLISFSLLYSATLEGIITNEKTGEPVTHANVFLAHAGIGDVSNGEGYFEIAGIDEGNYLLRIKVIGFLETEKIITISENAKNELSIKLIPQVIPLIGIDVFGLLQNRLASESISTVSKDFINQQKSQSLTEILPSLPGVDIQSAHQFGRNVNVSIRGSSDYKPGGYNNRVLLLLDGFPIQIPNSGAADWSAIPVENIARIEILHGPASALYGHNSMGGVINLITSDPEKDKRFKINVGSGSFDSKQIAIHNGNKFGPVRYSTTLSHNSSSGHRFNSPYEVNRGSLKLSTSSGTGNRFMFSVSGSHSVMGHPGFVSSIRPDLGSYRVSERNSSYIQGNAQLFLTKNVVWSNAFSLNQFFTRYYDRSDTPEDEKEDETTYDDFTLSGRSELLITKFKRWDILVGQETAFDKSDVSILHEQYDKPEQLTLAPYIQSKWKLSEDWFLSMGFRYDYRRTDPGNNRTVRIFTGLSPKLSLVYSDTDRYTAHISVNKGFRAPSISELYLDYETTYGLSHVGSPSLNPESVWAVETGVVVLHHNEYSLGVNLYYNRYEDMIDFVYALPVKAKNRTDIAASGFELSGFYRLWNDGTISMNYTYLEMEDLFEKDPILYRPRHKANFMFTSYLFGITSSLSVNYTSSQQYEDFLDDWEFENNEVTFPLKWLPEKTLSDIVLSKNFGPVALSVKVRNLLDTEYKLIQDYPMPGRNWMVELSYNESQK